MHVYFVHMYSIDFSKFCQQKHPGYIRNIAFVITLFDKYDIKYCSYLKMINIQYYE
jgi:hypothetical protein